MPSITPFDDGLYRGWALKSCELCRKAPNIDHISQISYYVYMPTQRHPKPASHSGNTRTRAVRAQGFYTATAAKNEFGSLLEQVIGGATIVITKHESPKAVLISMDEYEALKQAPRRELDTLRNEFDELLMSMQTGEARTGMHKAFSASPRELGKAAVRGVRKRD